MTLREFLTVRGLTAADFARLVGAPRPSVSRWLHARRRPSIETCERIEKVTDGAVTASDWPRGIYYNPLEHRS